jgi:hypothetical protein
VTGWTGNGGSSTSEVDMRVRSLLSLSAVLLALVGLLLVLQTGVALRTLANLPPPTVDPADPAWLAYWRTAAFARLFGVSLLAFGMVLWHMKPLVGDGAERRIGLTLGAGLGLAALIALAQQVAIFGTPAGWLLSLGLLGLAVLLVVAAVRAMPAGR